MRAVIFYLALAAVAWICFGCSSARVAEAPRLRTCKVCDENCCPKTKNCSCTHVDACNCKPDITRPTDLAACCR